MKKSGLHPLNMHIQLDVFITSLAFSLMFASILPAEAEQEEKSKGG
jgi:hypothetical protein